MKTKTYHHGASDERSAMLAKLRRMNRGSKDAVLCELEHWIQLRVKRYRKAAGGL